MFQYLLKKIIFVKRPNCKIKVLRLECKTHIFVIEVQSLFRRRNETTTKRKTFAKWWNLLAFDVYNICLLIKNDNEQTFVLVEKLNENTTRSAQASGILWLLLRRTGKKHYWCEGDKHHCVRVSIQKTDVITKPCSDLFFLFQLSGTRKLATAHPRCFVKFAIQPNSFTL